VNRGVPLSNILLLFSYLLPAFLEVTVPMAMLLAILVAFGRLSADSEMVAMRSSGMSLYQLVPPVAIVVLTATAATFFLSAHARPWGNRSLKNGLYELARTRASAGIKAQVFNDEFPGLVIYTERVDNTRDVLQHVLISDERQGERNTIFAREGVMVSDAEARIVTLRLRDGFIHTTDREAGSEYQTQFQTYDVNLDLQEVFASNREPKAKEMTLAELASTVAAKRAAGESVAEELVEYHRKFSIPFACIVFGLVAMPLGIQPVRAARAWGFAVSLAMIFIYYLLLSGGQAMAEQGLVPAVVGLWMPNVVYAVVGVYLFGRAAREYTLVRLDLLQGLAAALRRRLVARRGAEAPS